MNPKGSLTIGLLGLFIATVTSSSVYVYVDVEQGTLMGETVDFSEANVTQKIDVFKGVPYADPPRRFEPPKRRRRWGEWDSTRFRAVCPQSPPPADIVYIDEFTISEDCLYLNIFAPQAADNLLPVMVFIHGGAFSGGTSMVTDYSGVPMAAIGDVVVVTINYRLGVFGFLDTGNEAASGNYGLLDQAEAMRWVRTNIEAFGGDRQQITLFGESAGASSVQYHMLSEYSRDLFDQAILESGTAMSEWSFQEVDADTKATKAFEMGAAMGCNTDDMTVLVECLRNGHWSAVHNASIAVGYQAKPSIDGVFLTESPKDLMDRGEMKDCPMIIGFNRDEGSLSMLYWFIAQASEGRPFINKDVFYRALHRALQSENKGSPSLLSAAVVQQYMDWSEVDNAAYDYYETLEAIFGDHYFSCPAMEVARAHALRTSQSVFLYHMTHVPTTSLYKPGITWLGAGHGEELRFVFGYPFIPGIKDLRGPMTEEEVEFTAKFIRFWTNFAKSGDPSREDPTSNPGTGEWAWPQFTVAELQYKELSLELPVKRGLKANECAFWNQYKPTLDLHLASQEKVEADWRDEFSDWQDDLNEWRRAFRKYKEENSCI